MTWVGWRLQRTETAIALGIVALLAALLVPTGIDMANTYHQYGLGSCLMANPSQSCAARVGIFEQHFQTLIALANWFTLIPGLIGVLLAAPFIFDLEHGTYRLMWTQGITRGRWLRSKLGLSALAALVASGALVLLFTWWRSPQVSLDGRLDTGTYDTEGIVVIAYALFAFGFAVALGAVWRRAAASIAVAFVAYFALRVWVDYSLRNHLVSASTTTWTGPNQPSRLYDAVVLSQSVVIHGVRHVLGGGSFLGGHVQVAAGPALAHATFQATYLPASDFWPLQLSEAGVFAGAALLLVAFAAWWTQRRVS